MATPTENHIDQVVSWNPNQSFDHIHDHTLIEISEYLLKNLRYDHRLPTKTQWHFRGICEWYRQYHRITIKQRFWLMINLHRYLDQAVTLDQATNRGRWITAEELGI